MSKRPHIQSEHEKRVERSIQEERAQRDRDLAAAIGTAEAGSDPEPVIRSVSRGPVAGELPAEVEQWIETTAAEQQEHYRRIYREVEALGPARDGWVEEFFERISGPRGFSVHAGTRRTIPEDDLPERPERPWRNVW